MRVRIAVSAEQDLSHLTESIAENDAAVAEAITEYLKKLALDIGRSPRLYSPVLGRAQIRKRRTPPYLFLFKVTDEEVLIIRIVHERSDWMALV